MSVIDEIADARRRKIEAAKPVGLADCWKGAES